MAIASGSPCVVPSDDGIDSPSMKSCTSSRYVLMRTFDRAGQSCCMLRSAASRLSELNALEASTRMTASVSGDSEIWRIAWTADSQPARCPAHTCKAPVASWTSSRVTTEMALPMILLIVSPMPMGLTPGHLSRAINLQAT